MRPCGGLEEANFHTYSFDNVGESVSRSVYLQPNILYQSMEWLWNWSGACFGYRDGDDLWTYNGKHAGRFRGDQIFGSNGRYLGEVRNNRLITHLGKTNHLHSAFSPLGRRVSYVRYTSYVGNVMYSGYKDFPLAESF